MKKGLFSILVCAIAGSAAAQQSMYITGPTSNYGTASYGIGTAAAGAAFTVAAGGSYTAAAGAVDYFYDVASNAEIAGSVAPSFYNTTFDIGPSRTMAITNSAGAVVAGTLTWNNSFITTTRSATSTGALKFDVGSAYTATLGSSRLVDGYVSKTGSSAFTFPVGSATGDFSQVGLRTLAISAPATNAETYSTAWIIGDPTNSPDPSDGNATHSRTATGAGIYGVMLNGYWDWITSGGTGAGLTISVSIPDLAYFASPANLRLIGWNGVSWVNLSGSTGATSNANGSTVSGTMAAGITAISVGSTAIILPLHLTEFAATKQGSTGLLSWQVVQEQNMSSYTVERSADGRSFTAIGSVASLGNTSGSRTYTLTDAVPLKGANYYRLKMTEQNGTVSYSAVRVLNFSSQISIAVFPNPVRDKATVSGVEAGMTVLLVSEHGQIISRQLAGGNVVNVEMRMLPAATYYLQVLAKDGSVAGTSKVVKE